ncbi:WecB/TagA/CpsF family glycosyltransferase [Anoxybacillus flavithermus]|nr:WecB/TagA/CpsF family glycosyltransferase [Anoxybacillus flavithermus]
MSFQTVHILGVPFVRATMDEMMSVIHAHVKQQKPCFIVTANPEIVMKANEEPTYMATIQQADYVVADGIGVVKAAEWLGTPLPERVAGYDMLRRCLRIADEHQYRVYMIGAKEEVVQAAAQHIRQHYPNVRLVGVRNGYFDWSDQTIVEEVKQAEPDFVFVALGMGKQEQWIAEHMHTVGRGVWMGVGGSFDVLAGVVKRAPELWIRLNLEWLYRLLKQPTRAKRMMALPRFAWTIFKQKVVGK